MQPTITRRIISIGAILAATLLSVVAAPSARAAGVGAQTIASGLNWPAAFTFAPDGRIFYGERFTGQIRIYDPTTGSNTLFFTVTNLLTDGERGLLGIAIHPRYPAKPDVYAYATRSVNGLARNQILRIQDTGGVGTSPKVIFQSDVVANTIHNGGRILFGPDRRLYVVIGEANVPANSQSLTNDAGKILRMTATGAIPPDNPIPGSRIWSYGHRNSFGFTFDPLTSRLWETENGPECNDEINIATGGGNFGWGPNETCSIPPNPPANTNQDGPNPIMPLTFFTPTIAPVGAAFCVGCGLTGSEGDLLFMAFKTHQIWQVVPTPDRMGIASKSVMYTHPSFILSMERGGDGAVYFSDASAIYKLVQT